jgi:hypothetical protein
VRLNPRLNEGEGRRAVVFSDEASIEPRAVTLIFPFDCLYNFIDYALIHGRRGGRPTKILKWAPSGGRMCSRSRGYLFNNRRTRRLVRRRQPFNWERLMLLAYCMIAAGGLLALSGLIGTAFARNALHSTGRI